MESEEAAASSTKAESKNNEAKKHLGETETPGSPGVTIPPVVGKQETQVDGKESRPNEKHLLSKKERRSSSASKLIVSRQSSTGLIGAKAGSLKCKRTYSTISTPFLAGGELKLPSIISAIRKCGTNLANSIRDWNQEPCIEKIGRRDMVSESLQAQTVALALEEPCSSNDDPVFEGPKSDEAQSTSSKNPLVGSFRMALIVDLPSIKQNSRASVPKGLAGFRRLCKKNSYEHDPTRKSSSKNFIDLFTAKNGLEFIKVLEQIQDYFKNRIETGRKLTSNNIKLKIQALTKISPAEKEKELQDYDFPKVLEHDVAKFGIDVSNKIQVVAKLHNYGVKMILHWIYQLQDRVTIPPETIYTVGTEILSSMMIAVYGIFACIGERLMKLTETNSSEDGPPSVEDLIIYFRNLMDSVSDELEAIGESGAQIIIRTSDVSRELVEENLRKLYLQINYAEIALSRAMEALVPLIHVYARKTRRESKP